MLWDQEPVSTLSDLYHNRAQQLRNKYDYLVLWYSGGADSDTALNSFIDNNIHIDEIVSWVNYEATGDKFDFTNGEIFNVAIPKIKNIQDKFPLIKHRILDVCQPLVNFFSNNTLQDDWFYDVNCVSTPVNAARNNLIHSVTDWKDIAISGKKIAFITGTDKPRVRHHDNDRWTFQFIDMFDNSVTPGQQNHKIYYLHRNFFIGALMRRLS